MAGSKSHQHWGTILILGFFSSPLQAGLSARFLFPLPATSTDVGGVTVIYEDQMRSELKGSSRTKQRGSALFGYSLLKGLNFGEDPLYQPQITI